MGSWFSSPAGYVTMSKEGFATYRLLMDQVDALHAQDTVDVASDDAYCIRDLAYVSLQHYNSNHPGAEFRFTNQPSTHADIILVYPPTKDMKAACVGFRRDLWYHVNFSARPRTDSKEDDRTFFAELCYDNGLNNLFVKTCTILEKPPFRSSCALCPDESKILHPAEDAEFLCGKEGHEREFFRERCAWDGDGHTKEIFSQRDMLRTPFMVAGNMLPYRLVD